MIAHWRGWRSINCSATMAKALCQPLVGCMLVQQDVERGAAVNAAMAGGHLRNRYGVG
jgi:hypothetical protein